MLTTIKVLSNKKLKYGQDDNKNKTDTINVRKGDLKKKKENVIIWQIGFNKHQQCLKQIVSIITIDFIAYKLI